MTSLQWIFRSKVGPLYLVASEKGLQGIFWHQQPAPLAASLSLTGAPYSFLNQAIAELDEYFSGNRQEFAIPLDIQGTSFQQRVWQHLTRIPYGSTISYLELARRVQNDRSSRAVGTANGKNPLSIIVPCHRVIASDGSLGGYAGGLAIKEMLLRLERGAPSR